MAMNGEEIRRGDFFISFDIMKKIGDTLIRVNRKV